MSKELDELQQELSNCPHCGKQPENIHIIWVNEQATEYGIIHTCEHGND